ncbi:MAG: pirin family protein [Cyanophyceae cyanobacterium]
MSSIVQRLSPHIKDLGGFKARRCLPNDQRQMVGPFIFFDHLGPAHFPKGEGIDVRPHPHINLATVTYLFEGVLLHRDSLGTVQEIYPGAVNWMTAGRGIVHSERSPERDRSSDAILHAIQTWVALPSEQEETDPWFSHYSAADIPSWEEDGVSVTLIAGEGFGRSSPVKTLSPIIYLDLVFQSDTQLTLPANYSEQAVYSLDEGLSIDGIPLEPFQLAVLAAHSVKLSANAPVRCVVVGGEPVGDRLKWWNFVSSSAERIEQAKQDWQEGRFSPVPEETEFIPLPERTDDKPFEVQPLS